MNVLQTKWNLKISIEILKNELKTILLKKAVL